MKTKLLQSFALLLYLGLLGCGKAFFAVNTKPSSPASIPIILVNTDFYAEIGQSIPDEAQADFKINMAKIFSEAQFTGTNALTLEIRIALVGAAASDQVIVTGPSKPQGWDQGAVIFNQSVQGGNVLNALESDDIKAVVEQIIEQGDFWINVRVRYGGPLVPQTATIQNANAYIEGEKDLGYLSPLLNLSF